MCICLAAAITTANLIFIFVRFAICRFYDPYIGLVNASHHQQPHIENLKQPNGEVCGINPANLDIRTICT